MNLWAIDDYRDFIKKSLQPREGKKSGRQARLAEHLGVSNVVVSQVLSGARNLSVEQAFDTAEFLQLNPTERRYFLLMVQADRAGTERLKDDYKQQMKEIARIASEVKHHVPVRKKINLEEQGQFYSDRMYSVFRLATSISGLQTAEALKVRSGTSLSETHEILEFLVRTGLCKIESDRVIMGPTLTHLEKKSPWTKLRHHQWRQRAVEMMSKDSTLSYTAPVSLSKIDARTLHTEFLALIKKFADRVEASPPEELWCLNLDWFEV